MSEPLWFMGILFMVLAASATSWGGCRVDAGLDEAVMARHLRGTCSPEERMALAVSADEVLTALQGGKGVDLKGIVLAGDLFLDQLPLQPFDPALVRHAAIVQRFEDESVSAVRVIQGPLTMEDVEVQGVVATNLTAPGYVVVQGPVSLRGTTIRRSMDLSRVVFLDHADFSGMHVGHEGFFSSSRVCSERRLYPNGIRDPFPVSSGSVSGTRHVYGRAVSRLGGILAGFF